MCEIKVQNKDTNFEQIVLNFTNCSDFSIVDLKQVNLGKIGWVKVLFENLQFLQSIYHQSIVV